MSKVLYKKGEPVLAIVYPLQDIKDTTDSAVAEVETTFGDALTISKADLIPVNDEIRKIILANKIKLLEQEWLSLDNKS